MRKIVSFGILLFVVIAFSGIASATYVTDKLSSTSSGGGFKLIQSSNVIHYSKNHIVFRYLGTYQEWNYNSHQYKTFLIVKYSRDYKKLTHNKIRERNYDNENGYISNGWGDKVVKTKLSVYQQFKHERGGYKGVQSIYRHD